MLFRLDLLGVCLVLWWLCVWVFLWWFFLMVCGLGIFGDSQVFLKISFPSLNLINVVT